MADGIRLFNKPVTTSIANADRLPLTRSAEGGKIYNLEYSQLKTLLNTDLARETPAPTVADNGKILQVTGGAYALATPPTPFAFNVAHLTTAGVNQVTTAAHGAAEAIHAEPGVTGISFTAADITAEAEWLLVNFSGVSITPTATGWTGVTNNGDGTSTLPALLPGRMAIVHVVIDGANKFLNIAPVGAGGALIKGDWPMATTSVAPRMTAAGGNGATGMAVSIPGADTLTDNLDVTAGGTSILSGAFFAHFIEGDATFGRPTDARWSRFQVPDWATGSETSIFSMLIGYVDASATRQQLIDAITGAATTITFAAFSYQRSTQQLAFQHRVGAAASVSVDFTGEVLTPGDLVGLGFDWQGGTTCTYHNYTSSQDIVANTASAFAPASGIQFRPIIVILTQGVDDVTSDPFPFRASNSGDATRPGYLSQQVTLPAGAAVNDAFRVTGNGTYGGKAAKIGDTALFYPDLNSMQVFSGERGLSDAEVVAKGYQTAAQVNAIVAAAPGEGVTLISAQTAATNAHKGRLLVLTNRLTFNDVSALDDDWAALVYADGTTADLFTSNASTNFVYHGAASEDATPQTQNPQVPNGELYALFREGGDATNDFDIAMVRIRDPRLWGAVETRIETAAFFIGPNDHAGLIVSNATSVVDVSLSSQGTGSYPARFRTRLMNGSTVACRITVATGDSLNGNNNGTYTVRPNEVVEIFKDATTTTSAWLVGSTGRFKDILLEDYSQLNSTLTHSVLGSIELTFDSPERTIVLGANVSAFSFSAISDVGGNSFYKTMVVRFQQDATGGRTVTFLNSNTDFGDQTIPTMPTAANAEMIVQFWRYRNQGAAVGKVYAAVLWRSA